MTVRWGILSTARVNRHILAGARASDRVDVVAVASRDAGRADAYARAHDIERAYGGYEALLGDPVVDAVYISLPNALHVEWTLRALDAGKHVLVEKPLSRNPLEVERVFDVAEEAGLVVAEAFMWRHHPQTTKLGELVAEGAVGRVRLVRSTFTFPLAADAENVRLQPDLDGGALMDVGCYCVNAARFLLHEPEHAAGAQIVGVSGVDTLFAGTLRFAHDAVAHFDCGFLLPYRAELEVAGEGGVLSVADPWHIRSPGIELRRPGRDPLALAVPAADSYRLELENVSAAARGEAPLLLGRDDALGQARALEALYEAAAAPVEA